MWTSMTVSVNGADWLQLSCDYTRALIHSNLLYPWIYQKCAYIFIINGPRAVYSCQASLFNFVFLRLTMSVGDVRPTEIAAMFCIQAVCLSLHHDWYGPWHWVHHGWHGDQYNLWLKDLQRYTLIPWNIRSIVLWIEKLDQASKSTCQL